MSYQYQKEDLIRNDAVGGAAKRENAYRWSREVHKCQRWTKLSKDDLDALEGRVAQPKQLDAARERWRNWKRELVYAEENFKEAENLVKEAWK